MNKKCVSTAAPLDKSGEPARMCFLETAKQEISAGAFHLTKNYICAKRRENDAEKSA